MRRPDEGGYSAAAAPRTALRHAGPLAGEAGWDGAPDRGGYASAAPCWTGEDAGPARFRGGECVSDRMVTGDWTGKLTFRCAFGHDFTASPRLVLEGGHWCPQCERESWNYAARAKVDPFFAQVWNPLHSADEPQREYRKEVSELDVT